MKIRTSILLWLAFAGLALTGFATQATRPRRAGETQTSTQQPAHQNPAVRIDTDLVVIDVTATDDSGNYVRDLKADDFQVYEDGNPRRIDFFSITSETTLSRPLAVVFALDLSGSLKPEETETLRNAARKFTELLRGDSVFAAITFNYNVKVLQNFTSDVHKIEKAFSQANHFEGSTRIYDAIDRAVTMFNKKSLRTSGGYPMRRVVVVITDGFDSASIIDRKELIRRANAAGVTVYSVTLPSYILTPTPSGERVITPLDASRIVMATGGRDFAADARDFTPIFRALAEEIRASYGLAYYPDVRDGKYRTLRVTTTRPGVRLRASRTGYTAPMP
ncbi:MAG TPA: VWA domain-containing protein [Blastocatellia bacterium]|nr:VWA domain-containing protein [Blastocatellia bacterium]